jgi:beta-lactamase regulating signal transducer with metallopeptidase domain
MAFPIFSLSAAAMDANAAAAMVVGSAWQGLLIALGMAVCLRLVPRTSAEYRFRLWAAAFAAIVSLPLLKLLTGLGATASVGVAASAGVAGPLLSIDARWTVAIAGVWIAASLVRAGDLMVHAVRLRRIWRTAKPVEMTDRLGSMPAIARAEVRNAPVYTTTVLERPGVIGFLRPRILIPEWLLIRLTDGELEQIVLHEAEHLRRKDDWTNLLQKICLVIFPLNPALYWIERRLCREREMACDEGVIRITQAPRAYAACLASLAERGLQRRVEALSLGAWQGRPEVVQRVHSILRRGRALGPVASGAVMGVLGCGLVAGSVWLARSPEVVAFVPARGVEMGQREVASKTLSYAASSTPEVHGVKAAPVKVKGWIRREDRGIQVLTILAKDAEVDGAPKQQMVASAARDSQTRAGHEEQWVVLTAWEQVETSNLQAGLTADYDTGAEDAQNKAVARGQGDELPAGQRTVTRLIFRIVPAGSTHGKDATAAMHDGWLVLQL